MDIRLSCQRSTGLAVLPIVVVIGQIVLERGVGGADEIGLVISVIIAVGVGEVLTALEVAGTVTAVLIALGRVGDCGSVEGTMVYPATLDGCGEGRALLLTLHADAILGHVTEGEVSYLKALADATCIVGGLADKVQTPAVQLGVKADTLDGDILAARHSRHKAVVTRASAVVDAIVGGETLGCLYAADNTNDQRRAVICKLSDNVSIGVGNTALGVFAAANVLTDRVENIADARNGSTVL